MGRIKEKIKIQIFGDSISDEVWREDKTTWVTELKDYFEEGQIEVINSSVGGSWIGSGYAGPARYADLKYNNVYDIVTNPELFEKDCDLYIMFVGTNNWAYNSRLGAWGDATVDTFYGAARLVCTEITENTKGLFLICTPCGRYDAADEQRETDAEGVPLNLNGDRLENFCDALIKTARFFQCPVLDLYHDLGWNRYNVRSFCEDGLHPTPEGAKCIARLVAGEIRRHFGM